VVGTLDDLNEESGAILAWLSEDLEQISLVVVVNENLHLLNLVKILLHLNRRMLQLLAKGSIV
jgi:hypothetical protein